MSIEGGATTGTGFCSSGKREGKRLMLGHAEEKQTVKKEWPAEERRHWGQL